MNSIKIASLFTIISIISVNSAYGQHFRFEPTEIHHRLLVEAALLNGAPLQVNDEVGVFTPGNVCAGASIVNEVGARLNLTAWGADPENDNGFRNGDEFRFLFWDARSRREIPAEPDWLEGPEAFAANALSILDLFARAAQPPYIALSDTLHSFGNVLIGRRSDWTLTIRNIGGELLIGDISVTGEYFSSEYEGEFRIEPDALIRIVIVFEPQREGEFSGQVSISSNDPQHNELTVDLIGYGLRERHYHYDITEIRHRILVQRALLEDEPLQAGSEIGAFTPMDVCAGSSIVDEFPVGLTAFGDDPNTHNIVEGFREGENISFKIWSPAEGIEYDEVIANYIEGDTIYTINVFSILDLIIERPPGEFNWSYRRSDVNHSLLIISARFGRGFLAVDDIVGVFTPNGICAGYTALEGSGEEAFGIAAWADEAGDDTITGFRNGEPFAFRYWLNEEGREYQAQALLVEGDRTFTSDGFSVFYLIAGPQPLINLPNLEYDFGNIHINDTAYQQMVVNNLGDDTLLIHTIEGISEPFILSFEDTIQIAPDSQISIRIAFNPQEVRQYTCVLTINSNDPFTPQIQVRLSGVGIPPNRPPIWMDIPSNIEGSEGELLEFTVIGRDPDGDDLCITFSSESLPDNVSFVDFGNGTGSFSWRPSFYDAGEYDALFTLSDGDSAVEHNVNIVITDINQPPEIVRNIPNIRVLEDTPERQIIINLNEVFRDLDGDTLFFSVEAIDELQMEIRFIDGEPYLTYLLSHNYFGESTVLVFADDRRMSYCHNDDINQNDPRLIRIVELNPTPQRDAVVRVNFTFIVVPVNDPPEWVEFPRQPIFSREGEAVEFEVRAFDTDNERLNITLNRNGLPNAARFEQIGNLIGRFSWLTTYNDAGVYTPIFVVSDGELSTRLEIRIIIENINRPPVIQQPTDRPIYRTVGGEGQELEINFIASDPDNDRLWWRLLDRGNLPDGYRFNDNGDGTALFIWTPDFNASGFYRPCFEVRDTDNASDSITLEIEIRNTNRPPIINRPSDQNLYHTDIAEAEELRIEFNADDVDEEQIHWNITSLGGVPNEIEFTDNGNGTALFSWTPNYESAGQYRPVFSARDEEGLYDTICVIITVHNTNRSPIVIGHINNIIRDEDEGWYNIADLDTVFSDPDRDTLIYSMRDNTPQLGLRILQNGVLALNPIQDFNLPDGVIVTLTATDSGGLSANTSFRISILPINDAPSPFSLIKPLDGTTIMDNNIDFYWQNALDLDGDRVVYNFMFHLIQGFIDTTLIWHNLEDTIIRLQSIDTILAHLEIMDTTWAEWWVIASDGITTRESNQHWTLRIPPFSSIPNSPQYMPDEISLQPVYPNPFNSMVRLSFSLPTNDLVRLSVWDLYGKHIITLINQRIPAGHYSIGWNASENPNGIYIFLLEIQDKRITTKGVLIR